MTSSTSLSSWKSVIVAAALIAACGVAPAHDDHAGHAAGAAALQRSVASYALPDVPVINQDGQRSGFRKVVDDGRPVVLNFIYTTCNAICPVSSQVLMQFRELLGKERDGVNMVSVSIDPEQDSPRKLAAYARRFAAAGLWPHYTGSVDDSVSVQRAFGAWKGDKMNHLALTYLRARPGQPWIRLEGFVSPDQLVSEYRQMVAKAH